MPGYPVAKYIQQIEAAIPQSLSLLSFCFAVKQFIKQWKIIDRWKCGRAYATIKLFLLWSRRQPFKVLLHCHISTIRKSLVCWQKVLFGVRAVSAGIIHCHPWIQLLCTVLCTLSLLFYFNIFFVFFPFHFGDQFLIKLAAQRYRVPFYAKPLLIHHVQEIHYGILNINRFLIPPAGSFSQNQTLPRHVWLDSHRLLLHLPYYYAMLYAIASS